MREIVHRNVVKFVAAQRDNVRRVNRDLETQLARRGMQFNTADTAGFRRVLSAAFYERWKKEIGATAWNLLEREVGRLGSA